MLSGVQNFLIKKGYMQFEPVLQMCNILRPGGFCWEKAGCRRAAYGLRDCHGLRGLVALSSDAWYSVVV